MYTDVSVERNVCWAKQEVKNKMTSQISRKKKKRTKKTVLQKHTDVAVRHDRYIFKKWREYM